MGCQEAITGGGAASNADGPEREAGGPARVRVGAASGPPLGPVVRAGPAAQPLGERLRRPVRDDRPGRRRLALPL